MTLPSSLHFFWKLCKGAMWRKILLRSWNVCVWNVLTPGRLSLHPSAPSLLLRSPLHSPPSLAILLAEPICPTTRASSAAKPAPPRLQVAKEAKRQTRPHVAKPEAVRVRVSLQSNPPNPGGRGQGLARPAPSSSLIGLHRPTKSPSEKGGGRAGGVLVYGDWTPEFLRKGFVPAVASPNHNFSFNLPLIPLFVV